MAKRKYTDLSKLTPEEFREYKLEQKRIWRTKQRACPIYKAKQNANSAASRERHRASIAAKQTYRYHNDPEFRAKKQAVDKNWVKNNRDTVKKNINAWTKKQKDEGNIKFFIRTTYQAQKARSKKRGHPMPTYTQLELSDWFLAQPLFQTLFDAYMESGRNKWLAPSVDRIDNSKGYSFDNIQLMTFRENNNKGKK